MVTVVGSHFMHTRELSCRFGRMSIVRAMYISSSALTCFTPLHNAGTVMLGVSNNGVDRSHGLAKFVYSEFSITSVFPRFGIASSAHTIILTISPIISANTITCVYSSGISTEGIQLDAKEVRCKVPGGISSGISFVSLVLDGQKSANAIEAHFVGIPEVFDIAPSRGPIDGGTEIRVQGSKLNEIGVFCRFAGKMTVKGLYISNSMAKCMSPVMPVGVT